MTSGGTFVNEPSKRDEQEAVLLVSRTYRERLIGRTEVLARVGELASLPDGELSTTAQVAAFYGVSVNTVKSVVEDHRSELGDHGYRVLVGEEVGPFRGLTQVSAYAQRLAVFSRKAVLLAGMLLKKSPVAQAVRGYLLEVEDKAPVTARENAVQAALPTTYLEALRALVDSVEAQERVTRELEAERDNVRQLLPAASAWETFRTTGATLSVGTAGKYLAQRHGVHTGRVRLYGTLRDLGWVFKNSCEPVQAFVERGYVAVQGGGTYLHPKTGDVQQGSPRTRIAPKGLERLAVHFGVVIDVEELASYVEDAEAEGLNGGESL